MAKIEVLMTVGDWDVARSDFFNFTCNAVHAVHTTCTSGIHQYSWFSPRSDMKEYTSELYQCTNCGEHVPDEIQGMIALLIDGSPTTSTKYNERKP